MKTAAASLDLDKSGNYAQTGFQRGGKPVRLLGGLRLALPS